MVIRHRLKKIGIAFMLSPVSDRELIRDGIYLDCRPKRSAAMNLCAECDFFLMPNKSLYEIYYIRNRYSRIVEPNQ